MAAQALRRYIKSLPEKEQTRIKTYQDCELHFEAVTPAMLHDFEAWALRWGKVPNNPRGSASPTSRTTIGMYLRNVRAILLEAVDEGYITRKMYPFGKRKYTIPGGRNENKAIDKEDVLRFIAYTPEPGSMEQRGHDLWVFSYLGNGMNLKDVCLLKWSDLDFEDQTYRFVREKTARSTKADQIIVSGVLFSQAIEIINRWAPSERTRYVFPFINDEMDPERQRIVIDQVIKITNKYTNQIARKLEIPGKINSYEARDSFATVLAHLDVPLLLISRALGHTSLKTTEVYLGTFKNKAVKEYLKNLL